MNITVNGIQQLDLINTDIVSVLETYLLPGRVVELSSRIIKIVQFDGTAGVGAVGTINLYTVSGGIDFVLEAYCTETLVDASNLATISVGVTGDTAKIIPITGAAGQGGITIAVNELWHDASPDSSIELTSDAEKSFTIYNKNIIATIAGEAITDGVLIFSLLYTPKTSNAVVEAA